MSTNPFHTPPAGGSDTTTRTPTNSQTTRMRINTTRRWFVNHLVTGLAILSTLLVIAPLVAILAYLLYMGASSLNLAFFTHIPAPVGEPGGGMANAILGSGIVLLLSSLMGIPVGIAAGVYLAELFHQIAVATNHLRHQVAAALFCDPSGFIADEPSHRVFVPRQQ